MWKELERFDQDLTLTINSWNSPMSDKIWEFFSDIPVWIPLYVLILGYVIWQCGWKKGLLITVAALLTFGFCDQFSNIIKDITERLRPIHDPYMLSNGLHVLEKGGKFGFFSAHAANAFGIVTSTFTGLRTTRNKKYAGYAISLYIWAVLVGLSRIFVGKHFLGDVIVGTAVGIASGLAFGALAGWINKKYIK